MNVYLVTTPLDDHSDIVTLHVASTLDLAFDFIRRQHQDFQNRAYVEEWIVNGEYIQRWCFRAEPFIGSEKKPT